MAHATAREEPIRFETHPSRYRHWKLELPRPGEPPVARLLMKVDEAGGLRPASA